MESGVFFTVMAVFGGLALFLLGMSLMTQGLRAAAGSRLRLILSRAGRSPSAGMGLGTLLGFLVHSSAATAMLVAFVNAGLTTLPAAVPVVFGANLGTTLSMQLISFKLGEFAYFVIAVGFAVRMAGRTERSREIGNALLGFGLIFLGMNVMSDSIRPYRDDLRPLLQGVNSASLLGMIYGIGLSVAITVIIQSSGATIGMCFALIQADVFTDLSQAFPIILGAQIGTCITAILASIGTNIEARRTAVSHLLFNLIGTVVVLPLVGPVQSLMAFTSPDLLRQTANLNTFLAVGKTVIVLPFIMPFVRLVRFSTPSSSKMPETSHLDPELLPRPEEAIYAAIRELRRVAMVCSRSLRANGQLLLFRYDPATIQRIRLNEQVINAIKISMREYLEEMTHRYLSKRQAMLVQHLDRCIVEIERIGDHVEYLCDLSLQRRNDPEKLFRTESFEHLFDLFEKAQLVMSLVIESLDPENPDFQEAAKRVMAARDAYMAASVETKNTFHELVAAKEETALAGIYYNRYIISFDRIVKHAKIVALAEQQPTFWIKRKKLGRVAPGLPKREPIKLADPSDYIARLHEEEQT